MEQDTEEISLKELFLKGKVWFDYIWLHKFKILFFAIIGSILGICYSLNQKPIYIANLTFALEDDKQSGGLSSALATQFGLESGGGGMFSGQNLIELLKTRNLIEKTLLESVSSNPKTSLAEFYIKINKIKKDKISFLPNADRNQFTRKQDSLLGNVCKEIQLDLMVNQKDKKLSFLTIEYKSTNEVFAKDFTNTLARIASEYYIETKSRKARINLEILQRQLDSVRGSLNGAITSVAVANDNTFGLNPALNVKRTPSTRRQVDVTANSAILAELVKQTELAKINLRNETPLIQIIDSPIYPLEKKRFGKLKGIFIGGFIFGFLSILYFVFIKIKKDFFKE